MATARTHTRSHRIAGRRPNPKNPQQPREPQLHWNWGNFASTITALTALAALLFTALSLQQSRQQNELAESGQITDRFNAAVTNLGSGTETIRIGGIYALQRIMVDSPRDQPAAIQVLAAYIREHTHPTGLNYKEPDVGTEKPAIDVQAALTVMGARDPVNDQGATIDLHRLDLTGADLHKAHLDHVDLKGSYLPYADLSDADLHGADLEHASMSSAYLAGTDLDQVDAQSADFKYARLTNASMKGALLTFATLEYANFDGADLSGVHAALARMDGATFAGARLDGATFDTPPLCDAEGAPMMPGPYTCGPGLGRPIKAPDAPQASAGAMAAILRTPRNRRRKSGLRVYAAARTINILR